jgi:hypothetical protein
MTNEREDERLVNVMVVTGVGLGALLGAASAFVDIGEVLPGHVGVAVLAMPFGALIGLIIGATAGFVSGGYALRARRHSEPASVARGIRYRVVGVVSVFFGIVACLATTAGTDANSLTEVVGLPALTALVLGWLGSSHMATTYLRRELRQGPTV